MNDDMKQGASHLWDIGSAPLFYGLLWSAAVLLGDHAPSAAAPFRAVKVWPWPPWLMVSFFVALVSAAFWIMFNPLRALANDAYGGARKATEREIKKMGLRAAKGLILGVLGSRFIRTDEPLSVLVVAPPGSGKTLAVVVPCLLSCGNSIVAHDPKGELYILTAQHRAKFSQVFRFAPGEDSSAGWNLFAKRELPKRWEDIEVHVDRAANALLPDPAQGDKTWARGGRELFTFWALALIHIHGETSFSQILERAYLLSEDAAQEEDEDKEEKLGTQGLIAGVLDSQPGLPPRARLLGTALCETPYRQFQGYAGEFRGALNVFLDPRVSRNTSRSDFTLADLRRQRTTIYLCVKSADQSRLRPFLSLFCEMTALEIIKRPLKDGELRTTLLLDEMMRLNRLEELHNMPAISRGYGGNALFVFQSMSQAEKLYGREGVKTFKNTCGYRVVFSANDHADAKEISDDIGPKTRRRRSQSSGGRSFWRSISESLEAAPLYSPQDLMNLRDGKILVLSQGWFRRPVECTAAFWFKDSGMRELISPELVALAKAAEDDESAADMVTVGRRPAAPPVTTAPPPAMVTTEDPRSGESVTKAGDDLPPASTTDNAQAADDLDAMVSELDDLDGESDTICCDKCGRVAEFADEIGNPCMAMIDDGVDFCDGTMREVAHATATA